MAIFDIFFKRKNKKSAGSDEEPARENRRKNSASVQVAERETSASAGAPSRDSSAAGSPAGTGAAAVTDTRTPEERCGIVAGMEQDAIRDQLAKMFRRHNRLASSLDGDDRIEAEQMLDLIVQLRQKYLG